jgi:hypothetical protein
MITLSISLLITFLLLCVQTHRINKLVEYTQNNQHNVIELRKDVDSLCINAMEQAIKYYESIEDYNSCNILKNRISELNQRIKDLK